MPVTPKHGVLYGAADGSATTTAPSAPLVLSMQGYARCNLRLAAPGSGKSYAWSLTSRIPTPNDGSEGEASAWSTTALSSGTVSGTDDQPIAVIGDEGELQLTLSSPSGGPSYLIHYYLTD